MVPSPSPEIPVSSPEAPTVRALVRTQTAWLLLATATFFVLFWPSLYDLGRLWWTNPDFSHGMLVPLICAGILFANRERIADLPVRRSWLGLAILLVSLGSFFLGRAVFVDSLQRFGIIGAVVGAIYFVFGPPLLHGHAFPFLFLFLSVPPPLYNLSGFRLVLQGMVTRISFKALSLLGQPAFAEHNTLTIQGIPLNVTDACSGIRSLMAMVATAALFAYLMRSGLLKGLLLILTAIPVTILANVLRLMIMALALARHDIDLTASAGWPHDALGLACFALSLLGLYASWRFYEWFFRIPEERCTA